MNLHLQPCKFTDFVFVLKGANYERKKIFWQPSQPFKSKISFNNWCRIRNKYEPNKSGTLRLRTKYVGLWHKYGSRKNWRWQWHIETERNHSRNQIQCPKRKIFQKDFQINVVPNDNSATFMPLSFAFGLCKWLDFWRFKLHSIFMQKQSRYKNCFWFFGNNNSMCHSFWLCIFVWLWTNACLSLFDIFHIFDFATNYIGKIDCQVYTSLL